MKQSTQTALIESNPIFYALWSWSNWAKVFWRSYLNPLGYKPVDKTKDTVKDTIFFIRDLDSGFTWIRDKGNRWCARKPNDTRLYRISWRLMRESENRLVSLTYSVLGSEDKQLADRIGACRD